MAAVVMLSMIALAAFGASRFLMVVSKDPFENAIQTTGVIEKKVTQDSGNIKFKISFVNTQGLRLLGESQTYITHGKYKVGDKVDIKYFITPKGKVRVKVLDSEIEDGSEATVDAAKRALFVCKIFLILTAIFFVKFIVGCLSA